MGNSDGGGAQTQRIANLGVRMRAMILKAVVLTMAVGALTACTDKDDTRPNSGTPDDGGTGQDGSSPGSNDGGTSSGSGTLEFAATFLGVFGLGQSNTDADNMEFIDCDSGSLATSESFTQGFDRTVIADFANCFQDGVLVGNGRLIIRSNELAPGSEGVTRETEFGSSDTRFYSERQDEPDGDFAFSDVSGTLTQRQTASGTVQTTTATFTSGFVSGPSISGSVDREVTRSDSNAFTLSGMLAVASSGHPVACIDADTYRLTTTSPWGPITADPGHDDGFGFAGGNMTLENLTDGTAATISFESDGRIRVEAGGTAEVYGLSDINTACGLGG